MKRRATLLATIALAGMLAGCMQLTRDTAGDELIRAHPERFVLITLHNTDAAALSARAGSSPRDYGPATQYALAPSTRAAARELAAEYKLKRVREWPIAQLRVHCIVYQMDAGESRSDLLLRLRGDARVESAQPLNSFGTFSSSYNDPYVGLQRSFAEMGVPQAHAWSRGKGVSIAVIDTAVDVTHADLVQSRMTVNNFTAQTERAGTHGTAVAGIIAATGGNKLGIVGIAPEAQVHSLAACWSDVANPARAVCDSFTLAAALTTAIEMKVDIVNLSLGGPSDPLLIRLVEYGISRGMIFVAALPSDGVAVGFPSEIPGVVIVDAVGHQHTARNVLLAPGIDVLTLVPQDGYDFVSGSSMAAANVSGGIALLMSHRVKANEIREVLAQTAPQGDSINICIALAGPQASQRCESVRPPSVQRAEAR